MEAQGGSGGGLVRGGDCRGGLGLVWVMVLKSGFAVGGGLWELAEPSCPICWATLRAFLAAANFLPANSSVVDTSLGEMPRSLALLNAMVASGGGLGAGLVRCDDVGSVLVWVTVSESRFAAGGGFGGGLPE